MAGEPGVSSSAGPLKGLTCLQEKVELQNLNDRLSKYIDRVRLLESENNRLNLQHNTFFYCCTRFAMTSGFRNKIDDVKMMSKSFCFLMFFFNKRIGLFTLG